MSQVDRVAYLCHPALWPARADSVRLPLEEKDLPDWWLDLDEADQEARLRYWMDQVYAWLDNWGASAIKIEVGERIDRYRLASAGVAVDRMGVHEGGWSAAFRDVLLDVNPQYCGIYDSKGELLLEIFETWDSVVIYCTEQSKVEFAHRITALTEEHGTSPPAIA